MRSSDSRQGALMMPDMVVFASVGKYAQNSPTRARSLPVTAMAQSRRTRSLSAIRPPSARASAVGAQTVERTFQVLTPSSLTRSMRPPARSFAVTR